MSNVGIANSKDRVEALLWAAPTGPVPAPPVDTKSQVLPVRELDWSDAERLFLRLLHTVQPVQFAKLFGVPGQSQAGIDAYARLPLDLTDSETNARDYITLQSRRVEELTAAKVEKAIDDFVAGEWCSKTSVFYYATSFDLQHTKLDEVIRKQTSRLARMGITFVPWGVQETSALLKDHPRIVYDFFGKPWVERFCGMEAARSLDEHLSLQDRRTLRSELRSLYQAVFYSQGSGPSADQTEYAKRFIVLGVAPYRERSVVEQDGSQARDERLRPDQGLADGEAYVESQPGIERQSFRSARHLLRSAIGNPTHPVDTVEADEWLTDGKYRLLVGRPGAGKSSLLRFVATDLLSPQPQSIPLQREHAPDLPIWLPFGYLCRHLEASTENSVVSAMEAWLKAHSADHLWPLVKHALRDDRLLLLVDGVDEWSNIGAAEQALGKLETFLGQTKASAILSTRPYALHRLNWRLPWGKAEITLLNDQQRLTIASQLLIPDTLEKSKSSNPLPWVGVEPFLAQLSATAELNDLSRTPLFLSLLATTWQGEPLPQQRFRIYDHLVELLVGKHPQMRRRASHADGGPLPASEATTLFSAVAYRLRLKDPSGTVTKSEMRKLIVESMTDEDVLGYDLAEARRLANDVLTTAEDEFGLIVSYGAGTYNFLHRTLLDHMAGQYLVTLPPHAQSEAVQQFVGDPAWRDVLLALLSAQLSSHGTELLLAAALDAGERMWGDIEGYELLAEALAAGVKLTPKSQTRYINNLVERVETHPSLHHRANLIAALVGMLTNQLARKNLLPAMKRWLTAPRPNPAATMWALRELPIADECALKHLVWGLRHPEDRVKVNAALAIAQRFKGQTHLIDRLVSLAQTGPSSATQAAVILALGTGWAEATETSGLIDWARSQPSVPLRLVALHLLQKSTTNGEAALFRPEERAWLLSLLHYENWARGPWPADDLVDIAATGDVQVADFALETLTTNGRNGGDRRIAWTLACNEFADDSRFKQWTVAELAQPEERGLILYDPNIIPQQWIDDPEFTSILRSYLETKIGEPGAYSVARLATALPPEDAKAVLLQGLNSWRPYSAARQLVEQYLDDEQVSTALIARLRGEYERAAPLASIAVDVLGPKEGFGLQVSLLRQQDQTTSSEKRVVVALAVADAWKQFKDEARKVGVKGQTARDLLASYDATELATLCTAVKPHPLMWHVPSVITAWPEQATVLEVADNLLYDERPITSGISDTIPVAILQAFCKRTDEPSQRIFNKGLDLLTHLEPELREVLAFELARSMLAAEEHINVLSEWRTEPDTEVRRIAFIGLVQAIKNHQQHSETTTGADTPTSEMEWLRLEIKHDLCAYGPQLEEHRQLAWIGMLMLGDLTLFDNIQESIGHSGQIPGVSLRLPYRDEKDQILVDLVAENWVELCDHFGKDIFDRLISTSDRQRLTKRQRRRAVMSALVTVASRYPSIAEMIRGDAGADVELRHDQNFLLWAKEENQGNVEVLRALVSKLGENAHRRQDPIVDSLLDRESWNVSDEDFKAAFTEGASPRPFYSNNKLAIYTHMFPGDNISKAVFHELESWFQTEPSTRRYRDLSEVLTLALSVASPQDLPAILLRAHARIHMGISDLFLPILTRPLTRRLQIDLEAVEAFKSALAEPMAIHETSPILANADDPIIAADPDLQPLQRMYLFAIALKRAGALAQHEATAISHLLASASPNTIVHNPFTNHEGPLCLAALDLISR